MPTLFRPSQLSCFFCQHTISPLPRDPRSFRCPHCACLNRYDSRGEILSDEPAMHDEALNSRSFAKRASPSKDRLPTMYGTNKSIFCHTCQTNQMLLTNLLSNYLPSPDDVDHARRLETLPDYQNSLHARYPPVCDKCLPAVEEEIRSKDHMARTKALGGWLKQSKGKEKERKVSGSRMKREKLGVQLAAWKIRGCLWGVTLLLAVIGNSTVVFGYTLPHQIRPILPAVALLSILWTVWDPTYSAFRRAQIQGRDVRVQGKHSYIVLQMLSWFSRLLTSALLALSCFGPHQDYLQLSLDPPSPRSRIYFSVSLALELFIFLCSCFVLRLQRPPSIRLLDTITPKFPSDPTFTPSPSTSARSSPAPRPAAEPDLLAALTLSSTPATPNPIFGLPSLQSPTFSGPSSSAPGLVNDQMDEDHADDEDPDMMDWTPTDLSASSSQNVSRSKQIKNDDDGSWLRRQRFFPPEQPTGLESLFARTLLMDDNSRSSVQQARNSRQRSRLKWFWVGALLLMPLLVVAYGLWRRATFTWDIPTPHIIYDSGAI